MWTILSKCADCLLYCIVSEFLFCVWKCVTNCVMLFLHGELHLPNAVINYHRFGFGFCFFFRARKFINTFCIWLMRFGWVRIIEAVSLYTTVRICDLAWGWRSTGVASVALVPLVQRHRRSFIILFRDWMQNYICIPDQIRTKSTRLSTNSEYVWIAGRQTLAVGLFSALAKNLNRAARRGENRGRRHKKSETQNARFYCYDLRAAARAFEKFGERRHFEVASRCGVPQRHWERR